MSIITGDKQVLRILKHLQSPTARRRAMMSGLVPAGRVGAKHAKGQIPTEYKGVRAAMKSRAMKVRESKEAAVKIGAGVGKQRPVKTRGANRPGVGISSANVHWWFLGTTQRQTKSGKSTGAMPAQEDSVGLLMSGAASSMIIAARRGAKKGVDREVAKGKR